MEYNKEFTQIICIQIIAKACAQKLSRSTYGLGMRWDVHMFGWPFRSLIGLQVASPQLYIFSLCILSHICSHKKEAKFTHHFHTHKGVEYIGRYARYRRALTRTMTMNVQLIITWAQTQLRRLGGIRIDMELRSNKSRRCALRVSQASFRYIHPCT